LGPGGTNGANCSRRDLEAAIDARRILGVDGGDHLVGRDVACIKGQTALLYQRDGGKVTAWARNRQSRGPCVGELCFEMDDQAGGIARDRVAGRKVHLHSVRRRADVVTVPGGAGLEVVDRHGVPINMAFIDDVAIVDVGENVRHPLVPLSLVLASDGQL
jgi:hypothetical protein